jgi:hypothetical protein
MDDEVFSRGLRRMKEKEIDSNSQNIYANAAVYKLSVSQIRTQLVINEI